ncbi:PEP/pyruvate-binding domain-containing protein [Actinoplanes sp. NPDC051861]|uniref:PEP/pyruvate-binding domain-containing protein n=1 Tax=Actinoplanes sp. NPDC051861 TaxID=3155170 RepID=UPI00344794C6
MIFEVSASLEAPVEIIGAKARGLVEMTRLGLPVPSAFVIPASACRSFLRDGSMPDGLDDAVARIAGAGTLVSVRSGAAVSMPGMMNTILNVSRARVREAVPAVFSSWNTPRAVTYRELHSIPHDLGTAVIVQAMVFGDRDQHSGTGVAFSRDPATGERALYGEVLFGRQGDAVVAGESETQPLHDLAVREPGMWEELGSALAALERHYRDACHVEFTFEAGRLWFLQVRPGGLVGRAAVRVAVDLVDEGLIDRRTAVARVSSRDLRLARALYISTTADLDVLARGIGASPGVAAGRIALTADHAVQMARSGPVVLVRPHTSPVDMHGLALAAGVVTSRGGPTSHAAVVARSMAKPAVVAATTLTVDPTSACVFAGSRVVPEGTPITIDGASGLIVLGSPAISEGAGDPHLARLKGWAASRSL